MPLSHKRKTLLSRLATRDYEDDDASKEEQEQEPEKESAKQQAMGLIRLEGTSSSGRRTTRFILR